MVKEGDSKRILEKLQVPAGKRVRMSDYSSSWEHPERLTINGLELIKENSRDILEDSIKDLSELQELLWAHNSYSILVILQGMDAAGKDGIIKHVTSGINPQGCRVNGFKTPSPEELDHDFMWRCYKVFPERGMIGIFNRSYYEEVLVVKVHPDFLVGQRLPKENTGKDIWEARYHSINEFERHIARNGTIVLKFFLYVSKEEQKKRFLERMENPEKTWKFSPSDVIERQYWDQYIKAYEDTLSATSTDEAPWYVIPSDQKWLARSLVSFVLTSTIKSLNLSYPPPSEDYLRAIEEAKQKLDNEQGK
jgi:PPK2 family polyphosphate:nucleotide phosphotransferase